MVLLFCSTFRGFAMLTKVGVGREKLLPKVSFLHFIDFSALAINQWENVEHIDCTISNYTCASNGPEVLTALNFDTADYAFDIAILFAMIAAFRSIAYTALYFRVQR